MSKQMTFQTLLNIYSQILLRRTFLTSANISFQILSRRTSRRVTEVHRLTIPRTMRTTFPITMTIMITSTTMGTAKNYTSHERTLTTPKRRNLNATLSRISSSAPSAPGFLTPTKNYPSTLIAVTRPASNASMIYMILRSPVQSASRSRAIVLGILDISNIRSNRQCLAARTLPYLT